MSLLPDPSTISGKKNVADLLAQPLMSQVNIFHNTYQPARRFHNGANSSTYSTATMSLDYTEEELEEEIEGVFGGGDEKKISVAGMCKSLTYLLTLPTFQTVFDAVGDFDESDVESVVESAERFSKVKGLGGCGFFRKNFLLHVPAYDSYFTVRCPMGPFPRETLSLEMGLFRKDGCNTKLFSGLDCQ